jgi:uncharacterized protein YkwD
MSTHRIARLAAIPAAAALATPALAALAFAAPAHAAASCPGADAVPTTPGLAQARQATLCLLNDERRRHALRPIHANVHLRSAAQAYASTMVRHTFFSHVSPGGSTLLHRVRRTPYQLGTRSSWLIGENIAWGSGGQATPRAIVDAWLHSAGHRHNILRARFTHIGIGIAPGAPVAQSVGAAAATYVTDFGSV